MCLSADVTGYVSYLLSLNNKLMNHPITAFCSHNNNLFELPNYFQMEDDIETSYK